MWSVSPEPYTGACDRIAHFLPQMEVQFNDLDSLEFCDRPHQIALVVNGVFLLENLKLDELAAKRVHEFAFVVQPLKMQGFTGSTVAPVAIR